MTIVIGYAPPRRLGEVEAELWVIGYDATRRSAKC